MVRRWKVALHCMCALLIVAGLADSLFVNMAGAQEEQPPVEKKKYRLAVSFAKKDVVEKESEMTFSLEGKTITRLDMGGNVREIPQDVDTAIEQSEKYTDSIMDVTETGQAKKARREYSSSVVTVTAETEEGTRTTKEETPLDGKTFVIERGETDEEGFNVKYDGPEDEVPEVVMRGLTLDEAPFFLLPAAEVAVGETWSPSSENLKKFLTGTMASGGGNMPLIKIKSVDGTVECKLKEVVEEEGRQRAIVSYQVEAEVEVDPKGMVTAFAGEAEEEEVESVLEGMSIDMTIEAKYTGEFELCLLTSKYVRHETTGAFKIEMAYEQTFEGMGSMEADMKGKGTMERKETWKVSREE